MIITEEIKQICEDSCGSKDPEKRHLYKVGFYAGYAIGVSQPQWIDVKFKTLEEIGWRVDNFISTQLADYRIIEYPSKTVWYVRVGPRWGEQKQCGSVEHAKRLAQADYESKCKSLLKP